MCPDIDPNDPEAQKAATKIQAVFRGHKTRKEMKSDQDETGVQDFDAEFQADDKGEQTIRRVFFLNLRVPFINVPSTNSLSGDMNPHVSPVP